MKHLFYPFFALPVLLAAENLLPDASFELGGADYAKLRYARPMQQEEVKYLPPVPDQNTSGSLKRNATPIPTIRTRLPPFCVHRTSA